ncbi:MAG: T9SS type A sorting domain-containing protein [Bacteroidia bacterium]|nr:T9SS type A sorting domain-containing protein [Bacteroidia bacterium]
MDKNFTLKILMVLLFVNLVYSSKAQLNYLPGGFATTLSTYVDLGTNGDSIITSNKDDAFSSALPIGFTFNFNGAPYDSFVLSTNGFIKLGRDSASRHYLFTAHAQPPPNGPFTSATSPTPAGYDSSMLFVFGQDLISATNASAEYRVYTTGSSGSQVCTIQWKNVKDKLQGGVGGEYDTMNFQIKLYESTNVIEYIYGYWSTTIIISAARFAAVGIVGNSVTTAAQNLHLVKGSTIAWGSSVPNTGFYLNNAVNYRNPISSPAGPLPGTGRKFQFTPIVLNDASVRTIYAQGKVSRLFNAPDSIRAYISNNGVNAISSLVVTLTISGTHSYTTTATVSSLAAGLSTTVSFAPYLPLIDGASVITVSVPSDDNNANNVLTNSYLVSPYEMNYRDTLIAHSGSNGITIPNFWGSKFFIKDTAIITTIKAYLVSNSDATGDTVCGMILDTLGYIIGRSPNRIVQTSDLGTYMVFNISLPPTVLNQSIISGIAGGTSINGLNYFLGTSQTEVPIRTPNPFYFMTSASAISNSVVGTIYAVPAAVGGQTTRLMIENIARPIPQIDVAPIGASLSSKYNLPTGVSLPFRVIIKNKGQQTRPSGIAVRYSINNGPIIGPISTTTSIVSNDTASVLFSGTSALNFLTAGTYNVKIYTNLANDSIIGNDTIVLTYVAAPQNTLPFRSSGTNLTTQWTINNASLVKPIWKTSSSVTQANGSAGVSLLADNINYNDNGRIVSSSSFNFSGKANPTLFYSLAHAPNTNTSNEDTLDIEVSTDGGNTFTVIQSLTDQSGNPSLGTAAAQSTTYFPSSTLQWRHATVDLSAYANNTFVQIAFRSRSGLGNQIYINNINVLNAVSLSQQSVTSATFYSAGSISVSYGSSIGASSGVLSVSRFGGTPVFSAASPVFVTNSTATTNNSAVFTPNVVSPSAWFSINYSGIGTGNLPGTVPFDLYFNTSVIGGIQSPDSLYLVKRSEVTGGWVALNTTLTSGLLVATGLTEYGDFGVASASSVNTLPVKWLTFNATKIDKNNIQLAWSTASETNNTGFDIERSYDAKNFTNIGFVKGAGTSNKLNNYSFIDANANGFDVYYRLKQTDFDGHFSYSNIVKINSTDNGTFDIVNVQPNPFDNELNIGINAISDKNIQLLIYDSKGALVSERNVSAILGLNTINIDNANGLPKGFYVLKVTQGGMTKAVKLVK